MVFVGVLVLNDMALSCTEYVLVYTVLIFDVIEEVDLGCRCIAVVLCCFAGCVDVEVSVCGH